MLSQVVQVVTIAILFFSGAPSHASTFENDHLKFQLPEAFVCRYDNGLSICQSATGPKMKDAILVVALKQSGPQDSLEQYNSQLSQPRSVRDKQNVPQLSKVQYARTVLINGRNWVEAQHQNSEIDGYTTTYWATVANGVAALISFSTHANRTRAPQDVERIRTSLDFHPQKETLNSLPTIPASVESPAQDTAVAAQADHDALDLAGVPVKKQHAILIGSLIVAMIFLIAALRR